MQPRTGDRNYLLDLRKMDRTVGLSATTRPNFLGKLGKKIPQVIATQCLAGFSHQKAHFVKRLPNAVKISQNCPIFGILRVP